jgi:putative aldouronate transport system permease protein
MQEGGIFMAGNSPLKDIGRHWQLYVILLLPVAYLVVFNYIPMLGIQLAFKDFVATKGIWGSPWVGFEHFKRFFSSYSSMQVIWNTVSIGIYGIVAGFPMPILLAIALNETISKRFSKAVQTVTYMPYFISTVVMVGMILQLLDTKMGIVGMLGNALGFKPISLIAQPGLFSSIYVWSGVWQHTGFSAIIYVAALAGVSQELQEACLIDGATRMQKIWHVDLPHIKSTIVLILLFSLGGVMNVGFEKVFLMQNPLNSSASEVINTYIYKVGLVSADYSFSTAVGLFNSCINVIMLVTVNIIARKLGDTSLW